MLEVGPPSSDADGSGHYSGYHATPEDAFAEFAAGGAGWVPVDDTGERSLAYAGGTPHPWSTTDSGEIEPQARVIE